jgi:teichuronic acid biosynthesis glycosyltransferase TuaC
LVVGDAPAATTGTTPKGASGADVRWRRGLWISLLVAAFSVASLLPYMGSSAELVRMRNALLLTDQQHVNFNWTPANVPASFQWERGPVDPFFKEVAERLQLASLPDDWERALAISRHLLGSSAKRPDGAVMSDLRETYRRIVTDGDGYCGDFVDVFLAIAVAAGMPVRAWAFSFDGFGGHGHIWPEIWNRELARWQLVDIFSNAYFTGASDAPLSALELRQALLGDMEQVQRSRLHPSREFGMRIDQKAWDYYRRGLPEWYMWWGNNVFNYDRALLVRALGGISRSLEQMGGILQGVHPTIRILAEPGNQPQRERMALLRTHLFASALLGGAGSLAALVCVFVLLRARRATSRADMDIVAGRNADTKAAGPQILVFTNLFPHSGAPGAGPFIRERMFRVGKTLPLVVVVPIPWFPFQGLIRHFRPHFRPPAPRFEMQGVVPVFMPRFFSVPGLFRCFDGVSMALASWQLVRRLKCVNPNSIIDGQFAYPAGYAGVLLGKWLRLPSTITMRGTEVSLAVDPCRRARMTTALCGATRIFAVSDSLRQHAGVLGADVGRVQVIGNGVDLERFYPESRELARARFGLPQGAPVLVSVGGLVERKGFHRVIALLPRLLERHPGLRYMVVGGSSPEGDMSARLRQQVTDLRLGSVVQFLGALPPDDVRWPLSAADVFVLATSNEGWANVFLEAMACGLPVVTTDVGGNAEVVSQAELGKVVGFGDEQALFDALDAALDQEWNRRVIIDHARSNTWDNRITVLLDQFRDISRRHNQPAGGTAQSGHAHG